MCFIKYGFKIYFFESDKFILTKNVVFVVEGYATS